MGKDAVLGLFWWWRDTDFWSGDRKGSSLRSFWWLTDTGFRPMGLCFALGERLCSYRRYGSMDGDTHSSFVKSREARYHIMTLTQAL